MMYDELVKRLRDAAIRADSGNEISESLYSDILQVADAIERLIEECDAYRKAMTDEHNRAARLLWDKEHCWIPVTERLPEEMETVIVTDGKDVGFSFCVNDYGTLEFYSPWNITHWQPLPEPPTEKIEH